MTASPIAEQRAGDGGDLRWMSLGWLIVGPVVFAITAAMAYRPSFESPGQIALAVLPVIVLIATMVALIVPLRGFGLPVLRGAIAVALSGWTVLMFDNENWLFLTFVLYAVCFSAGPRLGIALAGAMSVVWTAAWVLSNEPLWVLPIPGAVFMVGGLLALTIYRVEQTKAMQAELIRELTETREELAAAERSKGVLEERARFASEIHDTLTQGFTSIVLVSRAALRTGDAESALISNEATALENLDTARRLVDAIRPAELDTASLPDALDRQVGVSLPADVVGRFQVVGQPRSLTGTVEVTLLRATQEALLNIRNHAKAQHVHVTLSYLDDLVALDVRDDGIGFVPGAVEDRGRLTGGQGLKALEERAKSLSGQLTIETMESGGSVVSVLLPTGGTA